MNLLFIHPQINKNIFHNHILTKLMGNIINNSPKMYNCKGDVVLWTRTYF